jgi:hypothetical protein
MAANTLYKDDIKECEQALKLDTGFRKLEFVSKGL